MGIDEEGSRELLSLAIYESESYESWKEMYEHLLERDLSGPKLVISDPQKGEVKAIRDTFKGVSWQRCQVRFMRNVFDKLPRKNTSEVRDKLKLLFKSNNIEIARKTKNEVIDV